MPFIEFRPCYTFTGRTLEFHVFPFSYSEYLTYYELENSPANFDKYIFEGGMAGSYVYRNDNDKYNYISSVFDTLVIRDIKQNTIYESLFC